MNTANAKTVEHDMKWRSSTAQHSERAEGDRRLATRPVAALKPASCTAVVVLLARHTRRPTCTLAGKGFAPRNPAAVLQRPRSLQQHDAMTRDVRAAQTGSGQEPCAQRQQRVPPPPPPPAPLSAPMLLLWLFAAAVAPIMVALLGVFARYLQV